MTYYIIVKQLCTKKNQQLCTVSYFVAGNILLTEDGVVKLGMFKEILFSNWVNILN